MDTVLSNATALLLTLALATTTPQVAPAQGANGSAPVGKPEPQPETTPEPVDLPVSVDRIQRALSQPPAIKPTSERPVFRVEVFSPKPTIEDILGPDYLRGPVPGGMTHQEFLSMVTPAEFRGYSMFTNREGMTLAATSLALQWALMKAIDRMKEARDARAREAARREVLEAMNQLEAANKKKR
ncbi:MAG TPA: hypothetical protein VM364_09865 [Vicinamibacterales bacterium]|nr:hypothetical protein [Vicinamibacterales bacterium]